MKAKEIIFLEYPCCEIVCSRDNDPETNDLREYARIVRHTQECGGVWVTRFDFAGQIEWTKHAKDLTPEQRATIERAAARYAEADREKTEWAKHLQAYQREKTPQSANKPQNPTCKARLFHLRKKQRDSSLTRIKVNRVRF